jgi:23S rRNA (uracil1939-C5)-methyltransferase
VALADKQARLLADLEAAGVPVGEVLPPLVGPTFGYRRRARLGIKWVEKKGKVLVGFRELDKRFVADLGGCEILAGDAGRLIRPIGELVEKLALRERVPQVEVTVADDAIALVFRVLDEPGPEDLECFRAFELAQGVRVYLQPGNLSTIRPLDGGDPRLGYRLAAHDVELKFLPTDFLQVNAALNEHMIGLALEQLAPGADDRILDLFCGLGNFTLPLARRAREVVGVEGDEGLVARAGENATRNGLGNARFVRADLYTDPSAAAVWHEAWDAVLLDPPRSGADQVLAAVAGVSPRRVVYVSCGPASFVRDAARLVGELGFDLVRVGVMDMFPQTAHVETIAVFVPRSGP